MKATLGEPFPLTKLRSSLEEPDKYLAKLNRDHADAEVESDDFDLPPVGEIEIIEQQGALPPIEEPQLLVEAPTRSPDVEVRSAQKYDRRKEAVR